MIDIDGSFGEGGGQILRSSLALSLLTGKAFRLRKIRANRKPKPGLQPQHLMSVRAAAQVGRARVSGDTLGSKELTFEPGEVAAGSYRFDIGTAGATALVLQTVYLPLAYRAKAASTVTLGGGTHVAKAPSYHFLAVTWRAYLERIGLDVRLEMQRPGFYPRGGGLVVAHISPCTRVHGLWLTKSPEINQATGWSAIASLPEHVAQRMARRAINRLADADIDCQMAYETWKGGPGAVLGLTLNQAPVATSFFGIGERGRPAETVADEAAHEAIAYARAGAPVDLHSADQVVLPLALAEEASEFRVTEVTRHLTTNIAVIQMFLERNLTVEGKEGAPGVVRIAGKSL